MIHTTPSDAIFEDMKKAAISVWETFDNEYGYVDEKVSRVNSIPNIQDNAMTFFRMFDAGNQMKMISRISDETYIYISENR
jgi:hypothetical protein